MPPPRKNPGLFIFGEGGTPSTPSAEGNSPPAAGWSNLNNTSLGERWDAEQMQLGRRNMPMLPTLRPEEALSILRKYPNWTGVPTIDQQRMAASLILSGSPKLAYRTDIKDNLGVGKSYGVDPKTKKPLFDPYQFDLEGGPPVAYIRGVAREVTPGRASKTVSLLRPDQFKGKSTTAQQQSNMSEAMRGVISTTYNEKGAPFRSLTGPDVIASLPGLEHVQPSWTTKEERAMLAGKPAAKAVAKPKAAAKSSAAVNNPEKTHSYTNADYIKWAKKYGLPGATSTSANGEASGINRAEAERAAAKATAENASVSSQALYQYLFLIDTLRKIDSDPQMAANMDPTAKAALRAMVQAQSQQMLAKAIGTGNAAALTDLMQARSATNPRGGWTGNAAPGAAAAYMQQQHLPQMATQHQQALQYVQQNPTTLPHGMSPDAYVNLSTGAANALQMPSNAAIQKMPYAIPKASPNVPSGALDAGFTAQAQGFSPFDSEIPLPVAQQPPSTYVSAYTV